MTESAPPPSAPRIDISLSIAPSTHSFSCPTPPTLTMTLLSHATFPITIFVWDTALHISRALNNRGITITDLETNTSVPTTRILVQRAAITRIHGSYDEELYLELPPGVPVQLQRAFGRNVDVKPLPKHIVQKGWEIDDQGRERRIRRSTQATGVDGLEAGKEYRIGVNMETLGKCRWAFATKDEVLVNRGEGGSYPQDFDWETERKIEWSVKEATVSVED
ncbi:unnamed protein product [Aureobasidium vineae]|uniref:Uncharacterized protein n=1 Tax=Aureobasidium vineae TaxID=2773715 RepID=A0A9N8PIY2_9PEZI|nr:unnamed protein product [Aureobasidium vineae]